MHAVLISLVDCAISSALSVSLSNLMRKTLGAICLSLLCAMLAAGLWPFNFFPRNEVSWLGKVDGIQFGQRARVHSSRIFEVPDPKENLFCSLELWLQPAVGYLKGPATILLFTTPDNPLQFRVRQGLDVLLLRKDSRDRRNHLQTIPIDIEHAFRQDEQVFFTVTTGPKGTSVYRNAVFQKLFPLYGLSCKDFSGELILGGTLTSDRSWPGKLFGIAIYERELTPEQVSQHIAMWSEKAPPESFKKDGLLALYSFSERQGRVVHNSTASTPDLYIPRIFRIPRKKMLALPWEEFSPDLHYVLDILINIAGFVPFGFCFFAYLTERRWKRAAMMTILAGGIVALTIEILQGFLISRRSGVTDIITNTIGTSLGVMLWGWPPIREFAAKLSRTQPTLP